MIVVPPLDTTMSLLLEAEVMPSKVRIHNYFL